MSPKNNTPEISDISILEKKLEESEERFRNLFDNASDSIYCYDSSGYFLDVNKTALTLLGCTREELIGTHISEWITPNSLKLTQDDLNKRIRNEPGKEAFVLDVIDKKGMHHCMEIRRQVVRQGDNILIYGIGRDITEKRRLEKDLRESEAKYRDLFENAQDTMYVIDIEGNILKMNQTGLQILGCTKEEVIGKNISNWLTPESEKIVQKRRKKRLSGENVIQTDILEIVCKNGEHRWAEIKTRAIKDGGRIIEIHGIARDITENLILRQELKKSNKQRKILSYLIEGTRGGKTRASILKHLVDMPHNAHQLAKALNLDYKTIRHHLSVLMKNGIITKGSDGYTDIYYLSKNMESDLSEFNREHEHNKK